MKRAQCKMATGKTKSCPRRLPATRFFFLCRTIGHCAKKYRSKFYAVEVERIIVFIVLNCIISLRVPAMSFFVDLIDSTYRVILTSKWNRINT